MKDLENGLEHNEKYKKDISKFCNNNENNPAKVNGIIPSYKLYVVFSVTIIII